MLSAGTHGCAIFYMKDQQGDMIPCTVIVSMCASWLAILLLLASWPSLRSQRYVSG